ncbi:S9 family peptidase [Algoriphagus namhaensis]|uniref:S9 family peptidase n=1 Tax=Algoriphagus namhaensis TaxID=915353 RepID=A0ABV8AUM7_9BACT
MPSLKAQKIPHKLVQHNHERIDNYYWMRDRDNPKVIDYLNEENRFLEESLAHTKEFQEAIFLEMKGRIKEDDQSVPYFKSGYYWYSRYEKGAQYPIFCRKKDSLEASEEIILDVNELAEGKAYYQVGGASASTNQEILGFSSDDVGRRIYTIHFKDLKTGEIKWEQIPETTGNFTWAKDNKSIFYSKQDPETLRANRVYLHVLGTLVEEDLLIFEEKDEEFTCHVHRSKSEEYIFIHSQSTISSEMRFLKADDPTGEFTLLQGREDDLEYAADHFGDYFWIRTNLNAHNFKMVKAPIQSPSKEHWEEVIPHRPEILFENFDLFSSFLVTEQRKNGLTELHYHPWGEGEGHQIKFPENTYTAWIGTNPEFESETFRFGYNSLTSPASTFEYDPKTREMTLLKQQEVQGGYDSDEYFADRIWAKAEDGVAVPISLVYKKSHFKNDGTNPCLLYAYGSYGYSMDAYFSSSRLSLLDRGFVFAIAHVRGGEDLGRQWYEDGKLLKKKNTFTDFISCAKHLISEKYTSSSHLYAQGGSAGGLLIGAVMNEEPELFHGMVANVPFVDVVTTMLDESIPLTTGEFKEWGNPKNKEYYDYMLSYSPYDNIESKSYPNLLVTSGLHDSQVQYWEPTKWVAKLRELKTDDNFLFLHTNMEAGHGGASGRFNALKELALDYTFLLMLEGKLQSL